MSMSMSMSISRLCDAEGDSASGQTHCVASHLFQNGVGSQKLDMGIIYQDQLRRTAACWRIVPRVFKLLWTQAMPLRS